MGQAEQMLKDLKAGNTLTFKDRKGKDFTVKYAVDKYEICQGLQMFQDGKKVGDRAMTDSEMLDYLEQFINQ